MSHDDAIDWNDFGSNAAIKRGSTVRRRETIGERNQLLEIPVRQEALESTQGGADGLDVLLDGAAMSTGVNNTTTSVAVLNGRHNTRKKLPPLKHVNNNHKRILAFCNVSTLPRGVGINNESILPVRIMKMRTESTKVI